MSEALPSEAPAQAELGLKALLASEIGLQGVPGCVVGVASRAKQLVAEAGVAVAGKSEPLTFDHHFRLSCVIKPMVAYVCHQLHSQGELDLDDDVARWLPELGSGAKRTDVSVRHLLEHTGGFAEPNEKDARWAYSWARLTDWFPSRFQAWAPGEVWSYTHTGYVVLAHLIERVTGRSLLEILDAEILGRLGVVLRATPSDHPTAALHVHSSRTGVFAPISPPRDGGFYRFSISDLTASASDLLRIGVFLAGGAPAQAHDRTVLKAMGDRTVDIPSFSGLNDTEIMPTRYHSGHGSYGALMGVNGSYVGSTCALRWDANSGSALVVCLNAWAPALRDRVAIKLGRLIARSTPETRGGATWSGPVEALAGDYRGLMLGSGQARLRVSNEQISCEIDRPGLGVQTALLRVDRSSLQIVWAPPAFAISLGVGPNGEPLLRIGASAYARDSLVA